MESTPSVAVTSTQYLFQALQALPSLPPVADATTLLPVFSFDATQLTNTVTMLWRALLEQRGFMDVLEKEMTRRRTETEVKLKNMQSEFEYQLGQEARKRTQDVERVKLDVQKNREELSQVAE